MFKFIIYLAFLILSLIFGHSAAANNMPEEKSCELFATFKTGKKENQKQNMPNTHVIVFIYPDYSNE